MGQRKNNRKNSTATVDNDVRHTKAEVTPLRPASTSSPSSPSATVALKPNPARVTGPTQEQIAQRAHEIWLKNGCKHGQDRQNWLEAETQLKRESGAK